MLSNTFRRTRSLSSSHFNRRVIAIALPLMLLITWTGAQARFNAAKKQAELNKAQESIRVLTVHPSGWPKGVLELVGVENLQSAEFPKGFGLRIKNISTKPVYFYQINVRFTDAKQIIGSNTFLELRYGPNRLSITAERPEPNDDPLEPGETHTLSPTEYQVSNFYTYLAPERRQRLIEIGLNRIELGAQKTSFGDGTGYLGNAPYPVIRVTKSSYSGMFYCGQSDPSCFNSDFYTHTGCYEHGTCDHQEVWNNDGSLPCRKQNGTSSNSCGCPAVEDGGDCGDPLETKKRTRQPYVRGDQTSL